MANLAVTICMSLFVFIIPILIGVYVFRDARHRGMNAPLWALVAILAPSMVGFIIYLLIRGSYSDLKCPQCGGQVKAQYLVCPQCGARLKGSCPGCGSPMEPGWKVCPHCATPVPQEESVVPPVHRKDRTLWKILVLVILIPVLFLALIVVLRFGSASGSTNMGRMAMTDYIEEKDNEEINAWLNAQTKDAYRRPDQVYAIRYKTQSGNDKAAHYLIYVPGATESTEFDFERSGFGDSVVNVEFEDWGVGTEPAVFTLSVHGSVYPTLKVFCNGEEKELNLWDFEFNPCLFDIVTEGSEQTGSTLVSTHKVAEIMEEDLAVPENADGD